MVFILRVGVDFFFRYVVGSGFLEEGRYLRELGYRIGFVFVWINRVLK